MASDAVGQERISRVVGYKIKKGNFQESSPNLPQRILIFGEANDANQAALTTAGFPKLQITTLKQAGDTYGYGSPIYQAARILLPVSGDGVGGIPVVVIPQAAAGGAAAKVMTITVTNNASGGGTHYVKISGRTAIDGSTFAINVAAADTPTIVAQKIADSINAVLGSTVSATNALGVVTITSKWKGLTAQGISVSVDTGDSALGLAYAYATTTPGTGTPDLTTSLAKIGDEWFTWVLNSYGTVSTTMDLLEAYNGIPLDVSPTGRYGGTTWKPFIAVTGSVADDPSSITDARSANLTIAIAPAPLSLGLPLEAAANAILLAATTAQNTPHLDIGGQSYRDMPTPIDIGSMAVYNTRDAIAKKGCSTVALVAGAYQMQDFVTTYHPNGENPPQYRYCRNLQLDFNVRYSYLLREVINVLDHVIAKDTDTVAVDTFVKPKQWKQEVRALADDLVARALVADVDFMKDSITVTISTSNPDRFETFFRYKRTGVARISATTGEAGFNFGTVN